MTRVVQRNFALAALVLSLLPAMPEVVGVGLILVNSVNPLQVAFISSLTVRNESGESLKFWVAGRHESGRMYLLPLFATELPAFPSFRTGGFSLRHGHSRRITYDWDDHNFSVLLVRGANGDFVAQDVDSDGNSDGCCRPHQQEEYVIRPLQTLRAATAAERALCDEAPQVDPQLAAIYLLPVVPFVLYRVQRRLRSEGVPVGGLPNQHHG